MNSKVAILATIGLIISVCYNVFLYVDSMKERQQMASKVLEMKIDFVRAHVDPNRVYVGKYKVLGCSNQAWALLQDVTKKRLKGQPDEATWYYYDDFRKILEARQ